MPRKKKPRSGSVQFWPRKRARRIYPRQNFAVDSREAKEAKPLGFAGWKAGMTHVQFTDNNNKSATYGKTITKTVTIIDAPSLFVCGLRFYKKTPSGSVTKGEKWSTKFPKGLEIKKKTNPGKQEKDIDNNDIDEVRLLVSTQPHESGMHKKKPEIFELGIGGSLDEKKKYAESILGKTIEAKDVFKQGEHVDVSAVSKGYGFTGPVKIYGIKIQGRKSKQMQRHTGSIGGVVPRKVDWRTPLPGQYGFFNRTETGKRVLMIDNDPKKVTPAGGFVGYGLVNNYIMIEGSVPGPRKRLIRMRKSMRTQKVAPTEITFISLESKQGR